MSYAESNIRRLDITSLNSVRTARERICTYSPSLAPQVAELKTFLRQKLYRHSQLTALTDRARLIITSLFNRLCDNSDLLPPRYREMLLTGRLEVVVADYIAGMTDRYAERAAEG